MIRIAAVQTNPRFGEVEGNLAQAAALVRSQPAALYVLPELFASGYLFRDRAEAARYGEEYPAGPVCRFLANLSRERAAVVAAGFVERTRDGRLYNAGALFEGGRPLGCYRKIHLFDREWDWFDPGDAAPRVYPSGAGMIGPLICFDWIFPETARCLALDGATILAHMANLVLPFCQDAMITRCLENRLFAVTANRVGQDARDGRAVAFTGESQIVGPDGRRLATASSTQAEVIVAEIDVSRAESKRTEGSGPAHRDAGRTNARDHGHGGRDLFTDRRPGLYKRMCGR